MNKYIIVSFLEKVPPGTVFSNTEWPLHVTILRPFFSDGESSRLIEILQNSVKGKQTISLFGKTKEMFGQNRDIEVTELGHTTEIQNLHESIKNAFKPHICFESEQYPHYRPHVTKRGNGGVATGEEVIIDSVSLVKMENDSRRVLAIITLV